MKSRFNLMVVLLAVTGLPPALWAEIPADVQAASESDGLIPKSHMRHQLTQLLKEEVGMVAITPKEDEAPIPAGTLVLDKMTVREMIPDLSPPPPESEIQQILRTGTLWEKRGPRFTRRFWVDGDRGVGFTLSW